MKRFSMLAVALTAGISLATGCGDSTTPVEPPAPAPIAKPIFPAPSRPAQIYVETVQTSSQPSRYVLYEDGSFALQYPGFEYPGTWSQKDEVITFTFQRWPWEAIGLLYGNHMSIEYNLDMVWMGDFVSQVYVRSP
ncbi:MAG: hypothetical protein ACR2GJ_07970 [Gemmatimonadaceae bacterium]|jgi:hypothetical protein